MPGMGEQVRQQVNPELRELIIEASLSLARLDADRLEELALSCQALNLDMPFSSRAIRRQFARQAREAFGEMAVLARVLEATRGNLDVLDRLRETAGRKLEYGAGVGVHSGHPLRCSAMRSSDGNH